VAKKNLKKAQYAVIGGPAADSVFFLPWPGVDHPVGGQLPDEIFYPGGKYDRTYNHKDKTNTYVWKPKD